MPEATQEQKKPTPPPAARAAAPAVNPFDGVKFDHPMLKLVATVIGPVLRHAPGCTADACDCGVAAAVRTLQQREQLVTRYGVVD